MDQENLFGVKQGSEPQFALPDGGHITVTSLRQADREMQMDVMRHWFLQRYEDPVQDTPYISEEGDYQYIWGGPYDAEEQLQNEFDGIVPDDVIEELGDEFSNDSAEWAAIPKPSDFDDYFFESITEAPKHREGFEISVNTIERLLEITVEAADRQCFLRLLYVNVITALETYLSDSFIQSVNADPTRLRKFVETTPEFRSEKISLSDLYKTSEEIEQKVKAHLLDVVWHRLDRIKPMFHDTLMVEFPPDLKELFYAIRVRHDLVHRNGKKRDAGEHILNEQTIKTPIQNAHTFVVRIEAQLPRGVSLADQQFSPLSACQIIGSTSETL
jgi:hypothetical protein